LLIVDNASARPLTEQLSAESRDWARIVREEKLGLIQARIRAFRETYSELVVFSDDDNVLAPHYLSNALEIFRAFPQIGVFGASITCEFEDPVEAPKQYVNVFSDPTGGVGGVWSNDIRHLQSNPIGAGLCVRREVGDRFLDRVSSDPALLLLGRSGKRLLSYEDTEIVRTACLMGLGKGIFSELRLTHLIAAARTTTDYILRLEEGHAFSKEIFDFVGGASPTKPSRIARLKYLLELTRTQGLGRRLAWARERGRALGRQHLAKLVAGDGQVNLRRSQK
jgi:hypothetical protein